MDLCAFPFVWQLDVYHLSDQFRVWSILATPSAQILSYQFTKSVKWNNKKGISHTQIPTHCKKCLQRNPARDRAGNFRREMVSLRDDETRSIEDISWELRQGKVEN